MLLTWFLWEKTTLSQAVIAENLDMKNAANVSRIIRRIGLSRIEKEVPEMLKGFVSEKMKENEPEPSVFETGSTDFKKTWPVVGIIPPHWEEVGIYVVD
jgi:hypothetical protein